MLPPKKQLHSRLPYFQENLGYNKNCRTHLSSSEKVSGNFFSGVKTLLSSVNAAFITFIICSGTWAFRVHAVENWKNIGLIRKDAMKGTRGMLQSSSNPCLRQYPFISLPSFVRLQISFSTLNMHANGGFKINWADFVYVYNLVTRILWILWLRNCTFSTFLIEHSPQFTPFIKFIKSCSENEREMNNIFLPLGHFLHSCKNSLLKLHDEPIECLHRSLKMTWTLL